MQILAVCGNHTEVIPLSEYHGGFSCDDCRSLTSSQTKFSERTAHVVTCACRRGDRLRRRAAAALIQINTGAPCNLTCDLFQEMFQAAVPPSVSSADGLLRFLVRGIAVLADQRLRVLLNRLFHL